MGKKMTKKLAVKDKNVLARKANSVKGGGELKVAGTSLTLNPGSKPQAYTGGAGFQKAL